MSICPHCSAKGRFYVAAFDDDLHKCGTCGLIYLQPHPTQIEMVARHASEDYAAHDYFTVGDVKSKNEVFPVHEIALHALRTHVVPSGRLIDVGAGTGEFLQLVSSAYDAVGIEPSQFLAEKIRARVGCGVFAGPFEDYDAPDSADAVVLLDVIEHVSDPRRLMAEVKRTLHPDGIMFISTVDSGSLLYRLGPVVHRMSKLSNFSKYLLHRIFCKQHNWYFNQKVLIQTVSDAGFEVIEHKGFEFPISRLNERFVVILGLRVLYLIQSILGAKTEQYLVARVIK